MSEDRCSACIMFDCGRKCQCKCHHSSSNEKVRSFDEWALESYPVKG